MRKRDRQNRTTIEKLECRTLLSADTAILSISSSNLNPTLVDSVTITAQITPTTVGGATPTGSVTLLDNGVITGLILLQPNGMGTTSAQLPLGTQSITATYAGDANYAAADSIAPVTETVISVPNTLDPSFGNAGILTGYEVLGIQPDGQLIATRPDGPPVLLNPDGSVAGDYSSPVPAPLNSVQGGTPLPPPLAVGGGKHLVLSANSLTRLNSDGTPDSTFGTNGTVSDFISGTSATAFKAYTLVAAGANVLVVGEATIPITDGIAVGVAVAEIDAGGNRVTSFGTGGLALESNISVDRFYYGQINVAQLGPDGKLYVGADQGDDPYLYRFDSATGLNDAQTIFEEHVEGPNLTGFSFQSDGKILVLVHDGGVSLNLIRLNTDFTPDTSFASQGAVQVLSPFGVHEPDQARADSLLIRDDGTILVSGMFDDPSRPAPDSYFTFAYLSHTATTTVAASTVTPAAGDSVTLTAHVMPLSASGPAPTGSVTFFSDGASIGSAAVQPDGTATLATTALPVGTHSITDAYSGDTNYGPVDAATPVTVTVAPVVQTVPPDPVSTSLTLSSSNIDPTIGDSVLLTAQVAPATAGAAVTGTVTFFSDALAIGTAPVQSDGSATFSTADLAEGMHAITAGYGGDANYASSQTPTSLTENVSPTPDIHASATGSLPALLIEGTKAHITRKVHVSSADASAFSGMLNVAWFLSAGTTIDSNAIALPGGSSKKMKIRAGKQATLTAKLDSIPASVPAGNYYLLLRVTDPQGGTSVIPSAGTITIEAPTVDLSGRFSLKTTATRAGAKGSETLVVRNTGNAPADGVLHFLLDATTDGTLGADAVQRSAHVNIKPGKSVTIHLSRVIMPAATGSYFLVAQLDPNGTFHDANVSNNLVVSSEPIVVS
ncbi:MAG TPA: Ig-like domain repeat protein [Tepidisphaeraceae bacterium]|jgi:hypothetical protein|nr:Ig-like domain repeat protein [Tepidisphaeraceae bacterium]